MIYNTSSEWVQYDEEKRYQLMKEAMAEFDRLWEEQWYEEEGHEWAKQRGLHGTD